MLFSGNSDLLLQIVKPHLNSSNDFSPLVISFQRFSFLCTSSWLSSTLFSSLSSPLNAFELVLAHLTSVRSTCPFSSQPSRRNSTAQASWIACPFDHGFQHSIAFSFLCHVLSFNPTGLLTVGPTFKHAWAAAFFPRTHVNMSVSRTAARSPLNTWQPDHIYADLEQTCHLNMPKWLKHAKMSVSGTAARSPLNTWQPDHVYAVFEQTCHLNMPTWAWAEQLHAPRWIPDSQIKSMQICNKHVT